MKYIALIISITQITVTSAFFPSGLPLGVTWGQGTSLNFGLPSGFGKGADNASENGNDKKDDKKITAGGLVQLITAGMGAPFLGDYQGVDEVREEYLVMSFSSLPQCFLCESKHTTRLLLKRRKLENSCFL